MTNTQTAMKTGLESFSINPLPNGNKTDYILQGPRGGVKFLAFHSWTRGVTFLTVQDNNGNNSNIQGNSMAIDVDGTPYLYTFGTNPYALDKKIREERSLAATAQ